MKSALVIISHYNAWPTDQLITLLDQTRDVPSGAPFRCLIVVNQAVDRPLELPERHSGIEILYRENTGYNIGAWEYGWRKAPPADFYLFLQEECRIVSPDWLGSSIRLLEKPGIGLVGESLAWPGESWRRSEYFHIGQEFWGYPGEPTISHIDGVKRFLNAKGVPLGKSGEHLQSFILATRRDVLEAIDGFMIENRKGDAVACEIAISLLVVAKGWKVRQAGVLPFRYILHPQWAHLNRGWFTLLFQGADRFLPLPLTKPARHLVLRLWKLCGAKEGVRELPPPRPADQRTSAVETRSS